MRAKTILVMLFLVSLGVAAMVVLRSLPQKSEAAPEAAGKRGDPRRDDAACCRHFVACPRRDVAGDQPSCGAGGDRQALRCGPGGPAEA